MKLNNQVVVTGVGVVSPIGIGVNAFWDALMTGRSGVVVRPEFVDTDWAFKIAGIVKDFEGKKYVKPRKAIKVMCPPIQFGFAAATMAAEMAKIVDGTVDPDRVGTVFGTEPFYCHPEEIAGVFRQCVEDEVYIHPRWGENFMREIQPLWMLKYLPNMVASHISIAVNSRGPSNSICQSEASSLLSIIEGATLIQRGLADVVFAGGTGSPSSITGLLYHGQNHLSRRVDDPEGACRPFDADRDGQVVGEGAGAIVLESESHAKARGVDILCRLGGWNRNFCTDKSQFADALASNFRATLSASGVDASSVGHINANGFGTIEDDQQESQAIHSVFGDTPVLAAKANFGNLGPGTGVIELVASILAMQNSTLPPAINFNSSNDCAIQLNKQSTPLEQSSCVKQSFSRTGQIASILLQN